MLKVLKHPLITHKLTQLRRKETCTKDFQHLMNEIAGLMAYEITRNLPKAVQDSFLNSTPMKRFGRLEDIAAAVAFLASEEGSYITGQVIGVDGGLIMC